MSFNPELYDVGSRVPQDYDSRAPEIPVQKIETSGDKTRYSFTVNQKNKIREERVIIWTADAVEMKIVTYNPFGKTDSDPLQNADSFICHTIPYNDPAQFTSSAAYHSNNHWHKWGDWSVEDRHTKQKTIHKGQIAKTLEDMIVPANGIAPDNHSRVISGLSEKLQDLYNKLNQNKDVLLLDILEAARPASVISMVQNMAEKAPEKTTEYKLSPTGT